MEPVDLLCSRNARSEKALVGRAQWEIKQAALMGKVGELGEEMEEGGGQVPSLLAEPPQ